MKKKAMKKVSAVLLSAAITACMIPAASFADDTTGTSAPATTVTQTDTTQTDGQVTAIDTETPLTDSIRQDLKSVVENYDTSAYDTAEANKIKAAVETAKSGLDSASTMKDANTILQTFYTTVSKLDTKAVKELKTAKATYSKKVSSYKTTGYSKTNTKKLKALKKTYAAKISKATTVAAVKSAYTTFKTKAGKYMTVKQQKALAKAKKTYIAKIRRYSVSKAPKKAQSKIKSSQTSAIKKINAATTTTAVKSAYNTFKTAASSAVKAASTSSSTSSSTSYLLTADGKKIYAGKTYPATYWGDNYSGRTIKVTFVDKMIPDKSGSGLYGGGQFLIGVDINNGGTYAAIIATENNGNSNSYKHGITFIGYTYNAYGKIQTSGTQKGGTVPYSPSETANGAASWLSNADGSEALTILKDNVTIVESIDGTAPTLEKYNSKWTKASTSGEQFSTYKWGFDHTHVQWIRMYEGNKLIYDKYSDQYGWDE